MTKKILTLCLLHQDNRILLGMKKRGFGAGKWNGFGGKVESAESIEDAAKREIFEEAGIVVVDIEKMGTLDFEFQGNPEILEVHIYRATDFTGEPVESDEMRPQWYDLKEIPYDLMWADDRHWFPLFLNNQKFTGKFLFGEGDLILEKNLVLE